MLITGSGDDTRAFRMRAKAMRENVVEIVPDGARVNAAKVAINDAEKVFGEHRARLALIGVCIEKADRNFDATEADYLRCQENLGSGWKKTADDLIVAEIALRRALSAGEWRALNEQVMGGKK